MKKIILLLLFTILPVLAWGEEDRFEITHHELHWIGALEIRVIKDKQTGVEYLWCDKGLTKLEKENEKEKTNNLHRIGGHLDCIDSER